MDRLARGAVLVAVAAAAYLNTLPNGLVVDDVHQIVENEWVTGPRYLGAIFTQGVWDFEGRVSNYYRPLMYVLYMGVYALAGHAAWAYHLLNVLFHAGATLLVAMLAQRVLPSTAARSPALLAPPLVAGLLFAVHPIHTEPVAWSAGIADLGLAVFGLLALWCHAAAAERGWRLDAAAAVACLAALLCKETAVVIPCLAVVYDLIFIESRNRTKRITKALACFVPAAGVYVGLRIHALGGLMPAAGGTVVAAPTYVLAVLGLLGGYVEKLVLPADLNFWHAFAPPPSFISAAAARAALVVGAGGATALAVSANRAARFAVVLILVPLLPTFNLGALNQGLENAFTERYLYLPSVGFVLLVAMAIDWFRVRGWLSTVSAAAAVLLMAAGYATATVARNRVWKDHLSLWSDSVRKSPQSAVAHMNYGAALLYAGRPAEGTAEMRRAAAMNPGLLDRELAKAAAYLAKGLHTKAILTLHTALALDPNCAPAHYNLALLYESRDEIDTAMTEYRQALALKPNYAEAHNNLGVLYAQQGDMPTALGYFSEAVRLRPDDPEYSANLRRAERR